MKSIGGVQKLHQMGFHEMLAYVPTLGSYFETMEQTKNVEEKGHNTSSVQREDNQINTNNNDEHLLWSQVPLEVLMRVLSYLPLASLFRVRIVCKLWFNLIQSSDFYKLCTEINTSTVAPHLGVCHVHKSEFGFEWAIFENLWNKWQVMPRINDIAQEIYISSRGLLCLLSLGNYNSIEPLLVWNPLTNHKKVLPPFLRAWSYPLIRIMFHYDDKSYRILFAGNQTYPPTDEMFLATEIYNSTNNVWTHGENLLADLRFPISQGAVCNGTLYFLASKTNTLYDILIKYNVDENKWMEVDHVIPSDAFCTPHLFEFNGQLLALMQLILDPSSRFASCGIFCFDFESKEWDLVSEIPEDIYLEFAHVGGCVAFDHRVCVVGNSFSQNLNVAVFNLENKSWSKLPPCPLAASPFLQRHNTFNFRPNLISS